MQCVVQDPKETQGTRGRDRVGKTIRATAEFEEMIRNGTSTASPRSELGNDDLFCLGNTCFPHIPVLRLTEPRFPEMLV